MPFPIVAKLAGGALLAYLVSGRKKAPTGPSSPSSPGAVSSPVGAGSVSQRMALVLSSGDVAAIRFEAGRLRQEGYPAQAAELEREATRIAAERAAAASAGLPPPPVRPVPVPAAPPVVTMPPVVVQTPQGPITLPAVTLPAATPAVTVQTPVGPVTVPSIPIPTLPAPPPSPPITITTPAGPVVVPSPPPLPVLAKDETLSRTNPGQTYSEKTKQWGAWLSWIGLFAATDVIGLYGPKLEAATKNFQMLANVFLKAQAKPLLKVDGVFGNQTRAVASLAHPPLGTGATANYFGAFALGDYSQAPIAASPLAGVLPPMAPKSIEPRAALAARLAHNLSTTDPGGEDRNLVQLFQMQEGLKPTGQYNPSTGAALALQHGIIPPTPRAWTSSGTRKSKEGYRRMLLQCGQREPQRREEWEAAARAVVGK